MTASGSSSKKMVVIFGPGAAGKMTVGMELSKITGFPLLHNHMTIELLLKFFEHGNKHFSRLDTLFRQEIVAELSKSNAPGMIFTFVWALNQEADRVYIDDLWKQFTPDLDNVCFVELACSQAVRLERNRGETRIAAKPSKANIQQSDSRLKSMDENYVLNSSDKHPFAYPNRHLKIDNTNLQSIEVAETIKRHFEL